MSVKLGRANKIEKGTPTQTAVGRIALLASSALALSLVACSSTPPQQQTIPSPKVELADGSYSCHLIGSREERAFDTVEHAFSTEFESKLIDKAPVEYSLSLRVGGGKPLGASDQPGAWWGSGVTNYFSGGDFTTTQYFKARYDRIQGCAVITDNDNSSSLGSMVVQEDKAGHIRRLQCMVWAERTANYSVAFNLEGKNGCNQSVLQ